MNKEEPVGCLKAGGSHRCSDNASEVQEPERREQGKSRITTLDFRRTDSGLFSDLLLRVLWDTVPWRERGARELADF